MKYNQRETMKINLKLRYKLIGYGALKGVAYTRLKAVSREECNNWHCDTVTSIKERYGKYIPEYRMVHEKEGYIWRNTLGDTGINGHHKNIRQAIIGAIGFVDIFIDEYFSYTEYAEYRKLEKQHKNRLRCQHSYYENTRWGVKVCPECGYCLPPEEKNKIK